MSFSAHSAFLCDRLLNMFCSAAYKLAPPFGHIKVELCPGLESNSWTKSAKPQCLCGIILFVLLYRNHQCGERFLLLSLTCAPLYCHIVPLVSHHFPKLCVFFIYLSIKAAAAVISPPDPYTPPAPGFCPRHTSNRNSCRQAPPSASG